MMHFKAKIKPSSRVPRNCPKRKPPFQQRPKGKQRISESGGNSSTKGMKCNAERQSNGQYRRQGGWMYSTQCSAQRVGSPGGNDNDDHDDNGDKRRHPANGNVHGRRSDLNWILLLLLVLVILCFCQLQLDSDTSQSQCLPHEHTCTSQHQPTSLDLLCENPTLDDGTVALYRGGIFSKSRNRSETDEEGTTSSSTFPGGNSAEHLVSEEEGPRFVETRNELAGVKKLHPPRRPRERPCSACVSPRPQPNLDLYQQGFPQLDSAPKVFTSPSPDADCQCVLVCHDQVETQEVGSSSVYVSGCSLYQSHQVSDPASGTCCVLTDDTVHRLQQHSPKYYMYDANLDSASHTSGQEEQDCEGNGSSSPAVFRGPDTPHKNSPPKRNEVPNLHTLDSGMGTGSVSNHTPAAQSQVVDRATVDTSWRTSLNKDELVYLLPSARDLRSSFPTVSTSVEEQTPRTSDYREELVGVKRFTRRRNLSEQPPRPWPVLESSHQRSSLLQSTLKVFSYPSPDNAYPCDAVQDVGDVHVHTPQSVQVSGCNTSQLSLAPVSASEQ